MTTVNEMVDFHDKHDDPRANVNDLAQAAIKNCLDLQKKFGKDMKVDCHDHVSKKMRLEL